MKNLFFITCAVVCLAITMAAPALAGNIAKESMGRGDLIEVQSGDSVVIYWVENNRNPFFTFLKFEQYKEYQMSWINLEKRLKAVYKYGTPEWCEKAKEYLK